MGCGIEFEAGKNLTPRWKSQNNDAFQLDPGGFDFFKAESLALQT